MANIEPHRPYRSLVPEAKPQSVGVIGEKVAEADAVIDIASIVKDRSAQPASNQGKVNRNGETHFRVQNDQLGATHGTADFRAGGGVGRIAAHCHSSLRPGAVERKTSQCAAATGK